MFLLLVVFTFLAFVVGVIVGPEIHSMIKAAQDAKCDAAPIIVETPAPKQRKGKRRK